MMTEQDRLARACNGRTGTARQDLQVTLPACGQPVRLARQVTREVLTAWRLAHVEENAVQLISELVTNAVRHARSTDVITLELEVVRTSLRIEVYRYRPGLPLPRTPGEFDKTGLGFAIVDALAAKWGVRETVTGDTTWAELDMRGGPGPLAR